MENQLTEGGCNDRRGTHLFERWHNFVAVLCQEVLVDEFAGREQLVTLVTAVFTLVLFLQQRRAGVGQSSDRRVSQSVIPVPPKQYKLS